MVNTISQFLHITVRNPHMRSSNIPLRGNLNNGMSENLFREILQTTEGKQFLVIKHQLSGRGKKAL